MDGADHLLVFIGDHAWFEWHERNEAGDEQKSVPVVDPDSQLGKLVRIELTSGEAEILASGFRNPQGFARDAEGNLWQTEHGPLGGDELNLLRPGLDYGWPYVTHGIQYGNRIWPYTKVQGRHDGFEKPVFAWIPSIAVSNLIFSDSQQFPLWQNDLLLASLKSQSLFRIRLHEKRVMYIEQIKIGERIRDITQMPDGRIALLSDSAKILFLQRAPLYCQDVHDVESIYSYDADDVCIDLNGIIGEADDSIIGSLHGVYFDSPAIRSLFNVYIHEDRLIYVKSPCSENDLSHLFFLHITPVHTRDLAEKHKQLGIGIFDFYSYQDDVGVAMNGDGCIVTRALPEYDIERIYTGQTIRVESPTGEVSWKGPIWDGGHAFNDPSPAAAPEKEDAPPMQADTRQIDIARIIGEAGDPIIRSLYDVYAHENRLIYAKSPCIGDDMYHKFFLHVTPVHMKDLSEEHEQHGFNVFDFYSNEDNVDVVTFEDRCMVAYTLPEYEIKHIYTGQVIRVENADGEVSWKGPIWEDSHTFSDPLPGATPEKEDAPPVQEDKQSELSGAALFALGCGSCHNLAAEHYIGPHLDGVIGRRPGRVAGFNGFSEALTSLEIVWTRENLAEFIANPSQFAPGTSMSDTGITVEEAQIIADFLASER